MSERAATVDAGARGWGDLLAEGRFARLALIWLGIWLNAADSLVTATLMPSVSADLGGYAWFSWTIAGFLVGAILANASAGRVSEILGLRRATTIAGLVFAGGCAMSALAPNMATFLIGRLIQGLGSGWISGFAMVAVAMLFPERHLGRVFASAAGVWGVATILGPLVGGIFASGGDWRWVFWLFAGQAMVFTIAAPIMLKGAVRSESAPGIPWAQLGVLGVAIAAIALADLAGNPVIAVLLVIAGLATLALVLRIDRGAPVRMLPHRAGDVRTRVGAGYLAMFAGTAASMPLTVYGPAILQRLRGLTPLEAGYTVAAEACVWTLMAFTIAGVDPPRDRRWIRIGATAILTGVLIQAIVMRDANVALVVIGAGTMGAGFGFSIALSNRRVIAALSNEDRAIGSSALMAVRQTGGAVGAAIAGTAANLAGFGAGLTDATARSTATLAFSAAIPLAVASLWASFRLTRDAPSADA